MPTFNYYLNAQPSVDNTQPGPQYFNCGDTIPPAPGSPYGVIGTAFCNGAFVFTNASGKPDEALLSGASASWTGPPAPPTVPNVAAGLYSTEVSIPDSYFGPWILQGRKSEPASGAVYRYNPAFPSWDHQTATLPLNETPPPFYTIRRGETLVLRRQHQFTPAFGHRSHLAGTTTSMFYPDYNNPPQHYSNPTITLPNGITVTASEASIAFDATAGTFTFDQTITLVCPLLVAPQFLDRFFYWNGLAKVVSAAPSSLWLGGNGFLSAEGYGGPPPDPTPAPPGNGEQVSLHRHPALLGKVRAFVADAPAGATGKRLWTGYQHRPLDGTNPARTAAQIAADPLWRDRPVPFDGRFPCVRWERGDDLRALLLYTAPPPAGAGPDVASGTGIYLTETTDQGATWSPPMQISATGTDAKMVVADSGVRHYFWLDADKKLMTHLRDRTHVVAVPPTLAIDRVFSSYDLDEEITGDGALRIVVFGAVTGAGGGLKTWSSLNGVAFTEET